jgi:putative SOS response-associated peptidase YedK
MQGMLPFGLDAHYALRPLIAPGEPVLALRQEHGRMTASLMLWGLLPEWSRDPLAGPRPFNARCETVAEKASFRGPWRHRRCLLPADAFWEKGHRLQRRDGALFWLAGVWDRWIGPDGSEVESCCVLTTAANALVAPIHQRMPVILPDGLEQPWLEATDGPGLRALQPLMAGWDPSDWFVVPPEPKRRSAGRSASQQLPLFP